MEKIQGIPAAGGYGQGVLAVFHTIHEGKQRNLQEAISDCSLYLRSISEQKDVMIPKDSGQILEAYEMLLSDVCIKNGIEKRVEAGKTLNVAIEEEYEQAAAVFDQMENVYMRQRAEDVRAVKEMLLQFVTGNRKQIQIPQNYEKLVISAKELSPADLMQLPQERIAGIILEKGGLTSHTVILAKAMGIPVVLGILAEKVNKCGSFVLVDGEKGNVILEPDISVRKSFLRQVSEYEALLKNMSLEENQSAVTKDGCVVKLGINIGDPKDFEKKEISNWDEIGLLRTEFLYTDRKNMPDFMEQKEYFQKAFAYANGKPLTIRTLDIGGDKNVPYLHLIKEENPFLGNRGIRLCLKKKELFCTQLKALLEAAEGREFYLMFPMISTLDEFCRAKELFEEVKKNVQKFCPVSENIKLGIMVETPAAAIMADTFASYVDFMSIGTNDLTQYVMAADRGNLEVHELYDANQPAVLRMIEMTVKACKKQKIEVSVCGEAVSDILCLQHLLSVGIRKFSVSIAQLGKVKYYVRHMDMKMQESRNSRGKRTDT